MTFEEEIKSYEDNINDTNYLFKNGRVPILFTAVHTKYQEHKNKLPEPYTAAICQYVANKIDAHYAIKSFDNGIDSNGNEMDEFKEFILDQINKYDIKLIIDVHGASINNKFDIEIGNLNGLSSDITVIQTLEECLNKYGINNIVYNEKFKGGGITKTIFQNTNIDAIQIEINKHYRDVNNLDECEKICLAIIEFSKIFANYN